MLSVIKTALKNGLKNWTSLLFFLITYKIIGFSLVLNLIEWVKASILSILGLTFIGQQHIVLIFQNPMAIFLLLCAFLLLIFYVYLEIIALFLYCEACWQGEDLSVWGLWKTALRRSVSLLHVKNLPAVIVMIPLIGFSVFPLTYGFMDKLQIPEFILDYIYGSPKLAALFILCMLVFNVLAFLYVFSLPEVILEKTRKFASLRPGAQLIKGKVLKTAAVLLGCVVSFILLALALAAAVIALLWLCSKLSPSTDGGRSFFQIYLVRWSGIGSILFSVLLPVTLYSAVITLYHQYREDDVPETKIRRTPRRALTRAAMVLAVLLALVFFSETELGGNLPSAYHPGIEVVAHRAGAAFAPENTLAALRDSIEAGAKMAEIDVQQTRDGVLIIMHDSSFLRTTGLDRSVWDTDYATVQTLDAGAFFSQSFAGERIPTLEEMLAQAKGHIRLMIELKSTGHEHDLVEQTVRQIKDAGMEADCVIASMDAKLLQRSKELAPEIETVYISSLAFSGEFDLDYVDGFSVETSFLTFEMVNQIQYRQKKIYAWTANTDSNIRKIIRLGADGLVTDNPRLASYFLTFYDKNYFVDSLADMLYPENKPQAGEA